MSQPAHVNSEKVLFHVGYHKTATTWMQREFFQHHFGFHELLSHDQVAELITDPLTFDFAPGAVRKVMGEQLDRSGLVNVFSFGRDATAAILSTAVGKVPSSLAGSRPSPRRPRSSSPSVSRRRPSSRPTYSIFPGAARCLPRSSLPVQRSNTRTTISITGTFGTTGWCRTISSYLARGRFWS